MYLIAGTENLYTLLKTSYLLTPSRLTQYLGTAKTCLASHTEAVEICYIITFQFHHIFVTITRVLVS